MTKLDQLLSGDENEESEKRTVQISESLDKLRITKYAFEKAYTYARLACEIAKEKHNKYTIECGGYLITPKEATDRVATDSFLARNQDVGEGLFTVKGEDVIKAGREINQIGYKVLGWWHSHGKFDTFFSLTDDNGQITVLNNVAPFNYVVENEEYEIRNLESKIKDGKLTLVDPTNPERRYELETKGGSDDLTIAKLKFVHEKKKVGWAYGLVVNEKKHIRKPYAELATREYCPYCRHYKDKSAPVEVELFEKNQKFKLDEVVLRKEVEDRVRMEEPEKKKYFYYGSYDDKDEDEKWYSKWMGGGSWFGTDKKDSKTDYKTDYKTEYKSDHKTKKNGKTDIKAAPLPNKTGEKTQIDNFENEGGAVSGKDKNDKEKKPDEKQKIEFDQKKSEPYGDGGYGEGWID